MGDSPIGYYSYYYCYYYCCYYAVVCPALPRHCPTHGEPEPPVTTQTSHACYSCHYPFRPDKTPLACLSQDCINLAHADKRCSGPTAPPTSGVALITPTLSKLLQACQNPSSPAVSTPETTTESPAEAATARLLPTSDLISDSQRASGRARHFCLLLALE